MIDLRLLYEREYTSRVDPLGGKFAHCTEHLPQNCTLLVHVSSFYNLCTFMSYLYERRL